MTVGFDTETERFGPGRMAPPLVCVSVKRPGQPGELWHWKDCEEKVYDLFTKDSLTGHATSYDSAVLCAQFPALVPMVFEAYKTRRVTDSKIRDQIIDTAAGTFRGYYNSKGQWFRPRYSLADLAKRHLGVQLAKTTINKQGEIEGEDTYRLRYDELREKPLSAWPQEAIDYAILDADIALQVYEAQEKHKEYLDTQYFHAYSDFWLRLCSNWGLITDPQRVRKFAREVEESYRDVEKGLQEQGLVKKDGVRDTKKAKALMVAVCLEKSKPIPRTDTHVKKECGDDCREHVSLDADACENADDPVLEDYSELSKLRYVISKDVPLLQSGRYYPVHTHFGWAESGRTTSSNPNIQNFRTAVGIREAFTPRPGMVFLAADYSGLELCTLAQVMIDVLGDSKLGRVLNAGGDPHHELVQTILGRQLPKSDPEAESTRRPAKIANFGFPGGMGIKAFLVQAKRKGLVLSPEEGYQLKSNWLLQWPDMAEYFNYWSQKCGDYGGTCRVEHEGGRGKPLHFMGQMMFTKACNTTYQRLGAYATKRAGQLIAEECYAVRSSALYGARIVNYIHDEYILEVPEKMGHDAGQRLKELMVAGAKEYLPDITIGTEPVLMQYWSKKAFPMFDNGRLVPWNGEAKS